MHRYSRLGKFFQATLWVTSFFLLAGIDSCPNSNNQTGNGSLPVIFAPSVVTAGSCNAFLISFPAPISQSQVLKTASLAQGNLYTDNSCQSPMVAPVVIPSGVASYAIYYRDDTPAALVTGTLSVGGLVVSFNLAVVAGAPNQFSITGPSSIGVGSCSKFQIEVVDADGNPVSGGSVLVTAASGKLYSDPACSTQEPTSAWSFSGASPITFYYSTTAVGAFQIVANDPANQLPSGSASGVVLPGAPVALKAYSQAMPSGVCAGFMVSLVDAYGNITSPQTAVNFSVSGLSHGGLFTDAACSNGATNLSIQPASETSSCSGNSCSGSISSPMGTYFFEDGTAENLNLVISDNAKQIASAQISINIQGTQSPSSPPSFPAQPPPGQPGGAPLTCHLTAQVLGLSGPNLEVSLSVLASNGEPAQITLVRINGQSPAGGSPSGASPLTVLVGPGLAGLVPITVQASTADGTCGTLQTGVRVN